MDVITNGVENLKIAKNTIYGFQMVKIDGIDVNFLSELSIDETYTAKITINDVERSCYNLIKDKEKVIIDIK